MKAQLEQRLTTLKEEFENGHKALNEITAKQSEIRNTLLRIHGAIQVIEEELNKAFSAAPIKEKKAA